VSRFPALTVNGERITYPLFEISAAKDILFIVDQLASVNSNSPENPLAGRFNLDEIGVVGYSSGGWPVVSAANEDSRIKAGISQDGSEPGVSWNGSQPFMFMAGGIAEPNLRRDYTNAAGHAYLVQINNFSHGYFSDVVLWPRQTGHSPPRMNGKRAVEIVNAYILAFFDQYLKGLIQPLLAGASTDFPEVTIESRNVG
jgi:hypothetical protein